MPSHTSPAPTGATLRIVALALAATCCTQPRAVAQTISASLVAQDPIVAEVVYPTTTQTQSHPAGPLTGTSLVGQYVQYSCSLIQAGNTWRLSADTSHLGSGPFVLAYAHADLVLTLSAAPGTVAALALRLTHFGDQPDSNAFSVDLGNDGTVEFDTLPMGPTEVPPAFACSHHVADYALTWDFTAGPLPIRIRTDNYAGFGAQGYALDLQITPWASVATPAAPGATFATAVGNRSSCVIANFQLAALRPTAAGDLATLRATGMGEFGMFLLSTDPTTIDLPPPQGLGLVPLLAGQRLLVPGLPTAMTTNSFGLPVLPRAWVLTVPRLPPGLTFYVQHASAILRPISPGSTLPSPFVGATNVVRIDT